MAKRDDRKLLEIARQRFAKCVEGDRDNRRLAVDDLKFLHEPGAQWDEDVREERGQRPCYEFNGLRISAKRIINAIRENRPQGKVRATEDSDKDTASILEGLARNIWTVSDGDAAVDTAAEYQVGGGMGAWRINTRYSTDDAWDQDIVIEPIRNPFALWCDPSARDVMKRDAEYWFLESRMSKEAYEAKYGKLPSVEWDASEFDDDDEWEDDDRVRICEYWYRKPVTKTLALLSNGQTVDMETTPASALMQPDGTELTVERVRKVQAHQICMAVISGDKVLEGPTEWAGSKFPFVQVYGESVFIDGKPKWWGVARHAKDSQRLHNVMLTNAAETAANAPLAKWWATPAQAQGHVNDWGRAHKENLPYLLFNPDGQNPGPPQQMNGSQVPTAFVNLAMITGEEIKRVTGIFDASLGQRSNETTGIAIRARQQQGEIANFNFADNMARGIRYTWELLIDLVPKVYDTERTVRVLGSDGAEQYQRVNTIDPQTGQPLHDLSRGKYDVAITVGPSFSTQRQEAAEIYTAFAQANPQIMGVAGDLIFRAFDLPYADEMAERMQALLPPPIQQMIQAKQQGGQMPPEAMAAMAQANQAMAMVQEQTQMLQQAAQEIQTEKMEVEKGKAELQKMIADLKVQEANLKAAKAELDAYIAQAESNLAQREAGVQSQAKDVEVAGRQLETQATMAGQQSAVEIVNEALEKVAEMIKGLEQAMKQQPQAPIVIQPPRVKGIKRTNGGHQVEYDE